MKQAQPKPDSGVETKTGRRPNPTIDGPRDQTVCFMLSQGEKLTVDRLAYCMNITRSGLLAMIAADFVEAVKGSREGVKAEVRLLAYLAECRKSLKKRGEEAAKWILP
jgi:hypothetical protein